MHPPHQRYEIVEPIAKGDFAVVYRGRDHELNRDVAIKQIHSQYLEDPRQLDRYWQEAQLLASLQHPHIMTIYDVVRERGWLILELAQGSLPNMLQGRGIDLKDLRLTLNYTLHGLKHLHDHGIVHGDIKPGNLLVDQNHRVKLGDFGIARRIEGDEGSVVKGTTKYMAPEVLSDQFGPVGPHSDLYSLGFTAYELMCGEAFETLFPGLDMYGRDRQVAWMMWHSAGDRRAPEVQRVLEGVPDDLARIIEKLIEKDPNQRYRTTDQVLADLSVEGEAPPPEDAGEEEEAAAREATKAKRQRGLAIAAVAGSLVLSLGMFFLPGEVEETKKQQVAPVVRPSAGQIVEIDAASNRFFLQTEADGAAQGVTVDDEVDRVYLNDERGSFADLATDDQVTIKYLKSDDDEFMEIYATRQMAAEAIGELATINTTINQLTLTAADGSELSLFANDVTQVTLNGVRAQFAQLQPTDRLTIRHKPTEDGDVALSIAALRHVTLNGFVVAASANSITVRVGDDWENQTAEERQLDVPRDCVVTLNGQSDESGRPLVIQDLRAKDRVALTYDVVAHRIEALRDVTSTGVITEIDYDQRTFTITVAESGTTAAYALGPNCLITSGAEQTPVGFAFLRTDDKVLVQRASPEPTDREAAVISVTPQPDPRAWALVIGYDAYDNPRMPKLQFAKADIDGVLAALRQHYRVPPSQLLSVRDATKLRMETDINQFLPRVTADSQLLVYFLGHGYVANNGVPYLVPQGFDERNAAASGVELRWMIDHIEDSAAREKLLLLDTTHESDERAPDWYRSAAEVAEAAKEVAARAVSKSAIVIAGCDKDQLGVKLANDGRGLFAHCFETAFKGRADTNRDHRVDYNELHRFLDGEMSKLASSEGKTQRPVLLLPDATPPRLSEAARDAIGGMLTQLEARRINRQLLDVTYRQVSQLADGEPEPHVVYGLILLKNGFADDAARAFTRAGDNPVALSGLAWIHFSREKYADGNAALTKMVSLPLDKPSAVEQSHVMHSIELAGKLSAYGLFVRGHREGLDPLFAAVKERGATANTAFVNAGRAVRELFTDYKNKIEATSNEQQRGTLTSKSQNIRSYVEVNYNMADRYLRDQMVK